MALVHGDEGEHGLAAEEVLVGDAVLVDLIALVEVAVLARLELELRDAEAEDCLLYTSDAADERSSVDLGGGRIIKKKKNAKDRVGGDTEVSVK